MLEWIPTLAAAWGAGAMTIYQLSDQQINDYAKLPEVAMATQVAADESGAALVIASGRIAIRYDEHIEADLTKFREFFGDENLYDREGYAVRMENWAHNLPRIEVLTPMAAGPAWNALAVIHLGPRAPLPGVPYRPRYTHGHLPFHGVCGGIDKYYRYEQFATSKRIDRSTNSVIAPDTYGAPESERDFTPTGLSAVGRFALPLLLPACWRYELTPVSNTPIYYGASVPLYGQSGGAVEVMFPSPFKNNGPIAAPTVLAIL
jgi:hypothetical protein